MLYSLWLLKRFFLSILSCYFLHFISLLDLHVKATEELWDKKRAIFCSKILTD